jgi:hypothetical protein
MGAKTCLLISSSGPAGDRLATYPDLDRPATAALVARLFPKVRLAPLADTDLYSTYPTDDEIHAACFPGVALVAARDFGLDHPSRLPPALRRAMPGATVVLHAMHSVVDWAAFALWQGGTLVRSLSLSPDSGILEDLGPRLPFEEPFWAGAFPAGEPGEDPDAPFPFHPLDLGEAALRHFAGFQIEGVVDPSDLELDRLPLLRFRREKRPRWRFW